MGTLTVSQLPEDMQVLIGQMSQDSGHPVWGAAIPEAAEKRFSKTILPFVELPLDAFPEFGIEDIDIDDRPLEAYVEMDPRDLPPVVVAHGYFLDGHHRVWAARERRRRGAEEDTILSIDVSRLVRPEYVRRWNLGRLRKGAILVPGETGATRDSLENARLLLVKYGLPSEVKVYFRDEEWLVDARFNGSTYTFEGFAWGYGGEGPHGLMSFLQMIGLEPPIGIKEIAGWPQKDPRLSDWPRRERRHREGPKAWLPRKGWTKEFYRSEDYGREWE